MRFISLIIFLLLVCAGNIAQAAPERWVVYYTNRLPAETFAPFDTIVFDSDSHPDLTPLKGRHKLLLGYISLGEAENYRSYYKDIEAKGLLLGANPQWKGHRVIDVRKPEWTEYVTEKLIPAVLGQGFDGIMIDTIDSVTGLDAKSYPGMREAAVTMIKTIRARYPNIKIMLNRGFDILPQVALSVDMVLAESICSDWQPDRKKPVMQPDDVYADYVRQLKAAQNLSPIKVYTLDYWPPKDKKGVRRIYAMQRAQGFIPYVATLNLQHVIIEP